MKIDGPKLKYVLAVRRIKQWQLARVVNISDSNLSKILLGRIGVSEVMLKKIADAVGVPAKSLIQKKASKC